ncbi:MAG: sortase [Monoglobaceae bacterium]
MKRAMTFIIIGCCLLLSAAALFFFNEISSYRAAEESMKILSGLESDMLSDTAGKADEDDGTMATRLVDGINIVGVVSVPSVEIEVPVAADWSYANLKKSACRYSGTAKGGRLIILAHNYKRHFGNLKNAAKDDEVQFLDVNGNLYRYKITDTEILGKYELDRLTESESDLTLFTCTYGGRQRVVVRCTKQPE